MYGLESNDSSIPAILFFGWTIVWSAIIFLVLPNVKFLRPELISEADAYLALLLIGVGGIIVGWLVIAVVSMFKGWW